MYKKILVPIDFSETSIRALREAIRFARLTGGALTLMYVDMAEPPEPSILPWSQALEPEIRALSEQLRAEHAHLLERVARQEIPEDVPHASVLRSGYPPEVLLQEIASGGYDLVVMGTHGRTGLKRVALGSVTERVARGSAAPLLVVR